MPGANYKLLEGPVDKKDPLTYYFSGIRFLNSYLREFATPKWIRKIVGAIDASYTTTDCKQINTNLNTAFASMDKGGISQLPSFSSNWKEMTDTWNGLTGQTLYIPISHCLKILSENSQKSLFLPTNFKLALGIIFGEIGAAIYKARKANVENDFRNEFEAVFVGNASIKSILDLHYMFTIASNLLLVGYSPKLLGSAAGNNKAPDIYFQDAPKTFTYYLEATRKEPCAQQAEPQMVASAIKEKIQKIIPGGGPKCVPLIISADITSSPLPISRLSVNTSNFIANSSGRVIYKAYNDAAASMQFQLMSDALAVSAIMVGYYRANRYDIAGVLVTRNHLVQIDSKGIAQAEGGLLVLHKDFETKMPVGCATHIYLVDSSCVPAGFVP